MGKVLGVRTMDGRLLSQTDPQRPLDWVYQNARIWATSGRYLIERKIGRNVFLLASFLCSLQAAGGFAGGEPSDIEDALQLHNDRNGRLRWAIEALILAGVPRGEIAAETGLSEFVLGWFEAGFFDVRSRLGATHFVASEIEQAQRLRPDFFPDYGWKWVAYHRGAAELRQLMGSPAADELEYFVAELQAQTDLILRMRLHRAAEQLPMDAAAAAKLLQRTASGKQADVKPLNDYEKCIQKMLENLKFYVGEPPADYPFAEFVGCAQELRTHEMLQVAAGYELPNKDQIKSATLRPPSRTTGEP